MSDFVFYKPIFGGKIELPALIEHNQDLGGQSVTFQKHLNEYAGNYEPCTLFVPAELEPEVYESVYGEKLFTCRYNGDTISVYMPIHPSLPCIRLPIAESKGKQYAYFEVIRVKQNEYGEDIQVGKKQRVCCEIKMG